MSVLHTENFEGSELVIGRTRIQYRGVRVIPTEGEFTEVISARNSIESGRMFKVTTVNTRDAAILITKDAHSGLVTLQLIEHIKGSNEEINHTCVEFA